jgi:hypothetical protein
MYHLAQVTSYPLALFGTVLLVHCWMGRGARGKKKTRKAFAHKNLHQQRSYLRRRALYEASCLANGYPADSERGRGPTAAQAARAAAPAAPQAPRGSVARHITAVAKPASKAKPKQQPRVIFTPSARNVDRESKHRLPVKTAKSSSAHTEEEEAVEAALPLSRNSCLNWVRKHYPLDDGTTQHPEQSTGYEPKSFDLSSYDKRTDVRRCGLTRRGKANAERASTAPADNAAAKGSKRGTDAGASASPDAKRVRRHAGADAAAASGAADAAAASSAADGRRAAKLAKREVKRKARMAKARTDIRAYLDRRSIERLHAKRDDARPDDAAVNVWSNARHDALIADAAANGAVLWDNAGPDADTGSAARPAIARTRSEATARTGFLAARTEAARAQYEFERADDARFQ